MTVDLLSIFGPILHDHFWLFYECVQKTSARKTIVLKDVFPWEAIVIVSVRCLMDAQWLSFWTTYNYPTIMFIACA